MVLEEETPSTQKITTEDFSIPGQDSVYSKEEKSDRESQKFKVAKQTLYSSEKGCTRGQIDIGSINSQLIHPLSTFQDANNERGEATLAQGLLDGLHRPKGRVLACRHIQNKKTILGIPIQKPRLAVQSNAFRPQHSTTHVHKSNSSCGENDGRGRNMVSTLLGRPSDYCINKGGVYKNVRTSNFYSGEIGMDPEQEKIPTSSSTSVRMARSSFRSGKSHSTSLLREGNMLPAKAQKCNNIQILLKKSNHATPRSVQLDKSLRPSCKAYDVRNKEHPQILQKAGPRLSFRTRQRKETQPLQMGDGHLNTPNTGSSSSRHYSPDRRFPNRLGFSDRQNSIQRSVRPIDGILNKHSRVTDRMVFSTHDSRRGCSNPHTERQSRSSINSQKRNLTCASSVRPCRLDMEKSCIISVDTLHISHRRKLQRYSRPTLQEGSTVNRVVPTTQGLSENIGSKSQPGSRFVCDKSKLPTGELCISLPGRRRHSSGCSDNTVGPMGSPISVSPHLIDFEGFSEIDNYTIHQRSVSYSRDSNQTMVYGLETESDSLRVDGDSPTTDGGRQYGKNTTNYQTTRLDVIEAAYQRQFPDCNEAIALMAAPLRDNSVRDYQHKWQKLLNFLSDKQIPPDELSFANVFQFFTYLFYERNLKPSTVAHYRSALTVPLMLHYNIDLKVPAVTDLLRAMSLKRPNAPASTPGWSLNKVLTLLDNLSEPIPEQLLLRKTAFLLLMATGWRISELHACVKAEKYCSFTWKSNLVIRPHPLFLAKNESPLKRWKPKEIKPLKLQNGTVSKLCPIATLRKYLDRNAEVSTGNLFVSPDDNQKQLSIYQLSTHVCKLILLADPNTKAKVHDVRKYATSCALAETMLVGNLADELNWSSPSVFFKFYMTQTEPLTLPVALPVLIPENQHMAFTL